MLTVSRIPGTAHRLGKAAAFADKTDTHAAPVQFGNFAFQCAQEQLHQCIDFLAWPAPVLAGEGKQGQRADTARDAEINA